METNATAPRANEITRQIRRFCGDYAGPLMECAALSERVAQLSLTFPVLFFALATRYGPLAARQQAVRFAVDGRPLADIASALGFPLCFRTIAPEACQRPMTALRWSPDASRRLAPFIPQSAAWAAAWLDTISYAHRACDERFAIWLAGQQGLFEHRCVKRHAIFPLAVFAWFSEHAELPGRTAGVRPWLPKLRIESTAERAEQWIAYLRLVAELGPGGLADAWLPEGEACGYRFVPLTTPELVSAEARDMHNCVATFGDRLARGSLRLFSVRKESRRVATLEIGRASTGELTISQMKGPANHGCSLAARRAASVWLARCVPPGSACVRNPSMAACDPVQELLAPYQRAKPGLFDRQQWPLVLSTLRFGIVELKRHVARPPASLSALIRRLDRR